MPGRMAASRPRVAVDNGLDLDRRRQAEEDDVAGGRDRGRVRRLRRAAPDQIVDRLAVAVRHAP